MNIHLNLYGVYVPTLLFLMLLALAIKSLLCRLLEPLGFYRLVWHPPLFNLALYVLLLGSLFYLCQGVNL